jgi:hypothetical protein
LAQAIVNEAHQYALLFRATRGNIDAAINLVWTGLGEAMRETPINWETYDEPTMHLNSGLLRGTDPEKALRLAEGSQNMPRRRGPCRKRSGRRVTVTALHWARSSR